LLLARQAGILFSTAKDKEAEASRYIQYLYRKLFKQQAAVGWTATLDDVPIGIIVVCLEQHPYEEPALMGFGELLFIRKAYRHQGVATILLTRVKTWMEQNHLDRIWFRARNTDPHYHELLHHLGAVSTGVLYEYKNQTM
jgi:GNAT superfamily N-acetyltransferase